MLTYSKLRNSANCTHYHLLFSDSIRKPPKPYEVKLTNKVYFTENNDDITIDTELLKKLGEDKSEDIDLFTNNYIRKIRFCNFIMSAFTKLLSNRNLALDHGL